MQKSFSLFVPVFFVIMVDLLPSTLAPHLVEPIAVGMQPLPTIIIEPEVAVAALKPAPAVKPLKSPNAKPVRLVIPAVGIDAPIKGVGINSKGEMAVPSGKTNAVGWYKYGPAPGNVGSAVIDAHVFAAFADLQYVKPGTDIYVINSDNSTTHFVVGRKKTYALKNLSPSELFRATSSADLNLITCAGKLTPDHSTYDHRLIVYATLAA